MESKKGIQLSQAFGAVLTIVLVAVLVVLAIVIFVTLASSFAGVSTVSLTNESVTITGSTGTVAGAATCGFTTATFGDVYNDSGEKLTITTHYTVDSSTGIITNVSEVDSPLGTSYNYLWGSDACDASEDMSTEFGNYTSLIGLVGTIIFLGLVIGVLVASFAFGGRKET